MEDLFDAGKALLHAIEGSADGELREAVDRFDEQLEDAEATWQAIAGGGASAVAVARAALSDERDDLADELGRVLGLIAQHHDKASPSQRGNARDLELYVEALPRGIQSFIPDPGES